MPPQKKFNKKKVFFLKKNFNNRAINSILIQSKANNDLLNCEKKCPYIAYEKRGTTSKFG